MFLSTALGTLFSFLLEFYLTLAGVLMGAFLIIITVHKYVKLNNRVTKELQYLYMLSTYNRNTYVFLKKGCKDTALLLKKKHPTSE